MPDGRRNNGGNSTKAVRANDKRLNPFRSVLKEALTAEEVKDVVKAMYEKAIKGDTRAANLLLNYYLGKPKESIEISGESNIQFNLRKIISFNEDNIEDAEEVD